MTKIATNADFRHKGDRTLRIRTVIINAYVKFRYLGPVPRGRR